jgi:hypothetical protein
MVAATLATAAFLTCWACLQFGVGLVAPVALGWAVLPFTIVLTLSGVWADQARRNSDENENRPAATTGRIIQNQTAGDNAHQIQIAGDVSINEMDN